VSERAIYILNTDVIQRFIQNNKEALVPILSKALYSNTFAKSAEEKDAAWQSKMRWQRKGHWNPTIVELTHDILKQFNDMDSGLMKQCSVQSSTEMQKQILAKADRESAWANLEQQRVQ
jgi:hypothetical protein